MLKPSTQCFLRRFGAVFTILLACGSQLFAQKVDLNGNGMSDVWENLFDAIAINPNLDSDGDGVANSLESIAGTNPFDANSLPRIPFVGVVGTNVSITMASVLGKFYQSQSLTNLGGNWVNETNLVVRAGTNVTLNSSVNVSAKFFRVAISDVDTDGDGLNDWEEYQLGLDPLSPASSGQLDANGQPLGDLAYVTAKLGLQNRVTITATDPTATEPDLGQSPTSPGTYTVTRDGFPLNSVIVNLGLGGPGTNYAVEGLDHAVIPRPITFPAGVSSQTIPLTPLANSNLTTPVIALLNVLPGTKYVLGSTTNASVVIYPSVTPTGTGLTGQYFTNASSNYISTANFNPANLKMTRVDTNVDFTWGNTTNPILNTSGYYTVRWTGQVQPQYSETYYFVANTDDGVKLWVNNQLVIDNWVNKSPSDVTGSISLQGGVRYNIKMEYYQNTGGAVAHLSWYSASQPKQIIPTLRLYALSTNASAVITSAINAVGFLGQPFSFNLTGANTPLSFTAKGLPPGLNLNSTNGLISGIPTLAGTYSVSVTASNTVGSGASVLSIQIFDTGSAVTREVWTNIPGTSITDIPVNTTANIIVAYGALEGITNYGDNYAERIRGYLTAPTTGNYYFWIAGSDSAELWISNDDESVNKVRRAYTSGGTGSRQWNLQPKQKSGWLALVAGQKYYLEVLHKAGASTNDNWSVGWLLDPVGTNNTPNGVVPGYVLSRYFALPPSFIPGTLYTANMLAQGTAISSGVGSATLRVSADGSQAVLHRSFTGLSSAMTGEHIHSDAYLTSPSQIMFDIDMAVPQADGSFVWNIAPVGTLSTADIQEIIREGKSYINI
ncbi:MAG: hypothetical protein QOD03_382, partial [Verrucomicrobiota bacterium]